MKQFAGYFFCEMDNCGATFTEIEDLSAHQDEHIASYERERLREKLEKAEKAVDAAWERNRMGAA